MKLTVSKKIGRRSYHFQVEGGNLHEVVKESNKLSFPDVHRCGICGSDNLELGARKAKDKFEYTFVKCRGEHSNPCGAELTFGQQMEDKNVFYLRKNDKGSYDWKKME